MRQTTLRLAVVVGLGVAAAVVHVPRPSMLCPLRFLTGVPCPFCGSTTAAAALGAGDPLGALLANPVTVLLGLAWVLGPLGVSRWWWGLPGSRRLAGFTGVMLVAWFWQLGRLGIGPPLGG